MREYIGCTFGTLKRTYFIKAENQEEARHFFRKFDTHDGDTEIVRFSESAYEEVRRSIIIEIINGDLCLDVTVPEFGEDENTLYFQMAELRRRLLNCFRVLFGMDAE